jgi:hypothetical protein
VASRAAELRQILEQHMLSAIAEVNRVAEDLISEFRVPTRFVQKYALSIVLPCTTRRGTLGRAWGASRLIDACWPACRWAPLPAISQLPSAHGEWPSLPSRALSASGCEHAAADRHGECLKLPAMPGPACAPCRGSSFLAIMQPAVVALA